jgi:hypothetical protein
LDKGELGVEEEAFTCANKESLLAIRFNPEIIKIIVPYIINF